MGDAEAVARLKRGDILPMALLGCFGVGAAQTCFTFGLSLTTAANTGLVFATAPVWGMLLAAALGLERPGWTGVIGVALSIAGVAVVVHGGLGTEGTSLLGDGLILLAAVCVGAYTVLSMPLLERHSPLAVATYPTLFAVPAVLLVSTTVLPTVEWGRLVSGPGPRSATPGCWPPPSPSPPGNGASAASGPTGCSCTSTSSRWPVSARAWCSLERASGWTRSWAAPLSSSASTLPAAEDVGATRRCRGAFSGSNG